MAGSLRLVVYGFPCSHHLHGLILVLPCRSRFVDHDIASCLPIANIGGVVLEMYVSRKISGSEEQKGSVSLVVI